MYKLLAAIVVSTFALSCASGFAADTAKRDELTQEQRMDMRDRADKLTAERAAASKPATSKVRHASTAKKYHSRKTKRVSRHDVKKAHPQS
jgi:hypothetical protein